jgi:sterol-4alpha-carboxylate 3-dehydrogenase (decarboxylating)
VKTVPDPFDSTHQPAFAARLAGLRRQTAGVDPAVEGRRFLLVGGTGFLGRYLVEEVLARGAQEARILCRTPPVDNPRRDPRITFATGSVADPEVVHGACQKIDVVFHSAAAYGDPPFGRFGAGSQVLATNVGGVQNMLAACRARGVRSLIYTSSVNVIFDGRDRLDADEQTPYPGGVRLDHYSRSKIQAEKLVLGADGDGLRTCVLRPNGIYGPREEYITGKVLPLARRMRGLPFSLDPRQRTDWTFVYNLVWAHLLCLDRLRQDPAQVGGRAYFITDGEALHTMRDIIGGFLSALGYRMRPWIRVPRLLMVWGCAALEWICHALLRSRVTPPFTKTEAIKAVTSHTHSLARARAELGYRPLITSQEGLAHMNEELKQRVGKT